MITNIGLSKAPEGVTIPEELCERFVKASEAFIRMNGWALSGAPLNGLRTMLNDWYVNKGWGFEQKFGHYPGYSDFRIITTTSEIRETDIDNIYDAMSRIYNSAKETAKPVLHAGMNSREIKLIRDRLDRRVQLMTELAHGCTLADGSTVADVTRERDRWVTILSEMRDGSCLRNGMYVDKIDYENRIEPVLNCLEKFLRYEGNTLDEEAVSWVKATLPQLKGINLGAKTSRVIRKIMDTYKIANEKAFAIYADAINPRNKELPYVVSVNPLDFETSSRSTIFTSCHSFNINHYDRMIEDGNACSQTRGYTGCYCAGQFSYMMDDCTIITFTLRESDPVLHDADPKNGDWETGGELWLDADKTSRQLFHVKDNVIVQSRAYPWDQKEETGESYGCSFVRYKPNRYKIEELFAGNANKFIPSARYGDNPRIMRDQVSTEGLQYDDYTTYPNPNITRLKDEEWPEVRMAIGRVPVCIECGAKVTRTNNIFCGSGRDSGCAHKIRCHNCNGALGENKIYFEGEWYCSECYHVCNKCGSIIIGRWSKIGNKHYCDECRRSLPLCGRCHNYMDPDSVITLPTGTKVCSEICATRMGYVKIGAKWTRGKRIWCGHCHHNVFTTDPVQTMFDSFCIPDCARAEGYIQLDNGTWDFPIMDFEEEEVD